jgi:hypothetical protein
VDLSIPVTRKLHEALVVEVGVEGGARDTDTKLKKTLLISL